VSPALRLTCITLLESFAATTVMRGVYFLTRFELDFSAGENLAMALGFGVAYVIGAMSSHPLSVRLGERRLLALTVFGQLVLHAVLFARYSIGDTGSAYDLLRPLLERCPTGNLVFVGSTLLAGLGALKWPVVESYVSAGQTPASTAKAVGRFNITWASTVPLCLVIAGPLIRWWPSGLFGLPALVNLASLYLIGSLALRPSHLASDHPDRPTPLELVRLRALLISGRWLLTSSYALLWVLAAILPAILESFGLSVQVATALAALIEAARLATFIGMERYHGWHNRLSPLVASLVGMPAGFLMVLLGADLGVVVAGEIIFGLAGGMAYFVALYYAMVVKNASVDAGGAHEGMIGVGFVMGPAAALAGATLAPLLNSEALGTLSGIGPMLLVCGAGAIWPLRSLKKARPSPLAETGPCSSTDRR
jgi:hypothetical protein